MANNIEGLYKDIFNLRDSLANILEKSQDVVSSAESFPGIISNVLTEQFNRYFIPGIKAYVEDLKTPGSIAGIVKFLDAVPLAYTREKNPELLIKEAPVEPPKANIAAPAGSTVRNSVENIPQNASYRKPISQNRPEEDAEKFVGGDEVTEKPFVEKLHRRRRESQEFRPRHYQVVRTSKKESTLGDVANLEDAVVYEFDTRDEAKEKADTLNRTIIPEEKDFFGTEYHVKLSPRE
jgi:hypothetical protein